MSILKFEVKGVKKTIAAFTRRSKKIDNTRGANLAAATTIKGWTIRNINQEGRLHDEGKFRWPPLKPSTIEARRRGGGLGEPKPLQDTGRLKGGFEASATKGFGIVRNNVNYAPVHEFGTNKVPQRKMFPSKKQATDLVLPVYEKFVNKAIK